MMQSPFDMPLPIRLTPSPVRRAIGVAAVAGLGGFIAFLGLDATGTPPWGRVLLVLIGLACLALASWTWQATAKGVELSEAGLSDGSGRVLAGIEDIASVDRSPFAFKPSNGFVVKLHRPLPRAWAPGLWWRWGRMLGVGGVTDRDTAKLMADALSLRLAARADQSSQSS